MTDHHVLSEPEIRKMENPIGRITLHDPRSRSYAYSRTAPIAGRSVRHRFDARNVDQFYTSGCVGYSGSNLLNCALAKESRRRFNAVYGGHRGGWLRYLDNTDGLENYSQSTRRDPFNWQYPPTDSGSSALGLMKFWKEIGVITGYTWAFSFDQFLAALQHQPVLVGTNWYESFMEPDEDGVAQIGGDSVGGHEYLATAILWGMRLIGFENSWGENWGLRGRFYLHFDTVERLLSEDGDVATPELL